MSPAYLCNFLEGSILRVEEQEVQPRARGRRPRATEAILTAFEELMLWADVGGTSTGRRTIDKPFVFEQSRTEAKTASPGSGTVRHVELFH
jgi:hypothetical protein